MIVSRWEACSGLSGTGTAVSVPPSATAALSSCSAAALRVSIPDCTAAGALVDLVRVVKNGQFSFTDLVLAAMRNGQFSFTDTDIIIIIIKVLIMKAQNLVSRLF